MNRLAWVDGVASPLFYEHNYFEKLNEEYIFTIAMTMQPYFISLLETLTHKEREHCKELAQKSLPTAVRKYVITLLESKPEKIKQTEEKFLQGYSESGKRWLRRTAQEFLESALYNLYGTAYELRILLNQTHLAISRSHSTSPFLKPLKRRMREIVKPINLFFAPLPWIVELSYLALSYPGYAIIDGNSVVSFDDALRLVYLDSKRLETVRFSIEHDPFIGEKNPYTEEVLRKLESIHYDIKQFKQVPFHKSIISLYGMMALIYEELGMIQNSQAIVSKFLSVIPLLIDFIKKLTESSAVGYRKEWFDVTIFLAIVSLQVVNRATGWGDEDIGKLRNQLFKLITLIKENDEVISTGEVPLTARASAWLATHGYVDDAYHLLNSAGWFSTDPEIAFRPIERIDFSIAHFWCMTKEKNWASALKTIIKLEQIIPQRPVYYYLTEILRFVIALLKNDYELLLSTAERVYHWNRRHPNFFPTLGKVLRYTALKAPRIIFPSDWNDIIERISKLYKQFPFYLTNVEKHTRLLNIILQKSNKKTMPVTIHSTNTENTIDVTPLEDIISALVNHINSKSLNDEKNNHTDN